MNASREYTCSCLCTVYYDELLAVLGAAETTPKLRENGWFVALNDD